MGYDFGWKMVYEKNSHQEGFVPIFERHGGMSKKAQANFHDVTMFAFHRPILLVRMWA
jgi:hypothetical protein